MVGCVGCLSYELGGTVWQADISSLTYGQISVSATVTDDAGNTATASTVIDSDTTADELGDLSVTVDPVINDEESGNVTLTLSGVDADAETVTVTLTDGEGTAVTAAAVAGNNGDWTVDVSGGTLVDGAVSVFVDVVDDAGNTASVSTSFQLGTVNRAPTFTETVVSLSDPGPEVVVNAYTTGDQSHPSVTSLDGGGFFVAWTDQSGLDGNANGVFGRFLHADGVLAGSDIQINSDAFIGLALDSQSHIEVGTLSSGELFAVWGVGVPPGRILQWDFRSQDQPRRNPRSRDSDQPHNESVAE